jgi:galactokinase
MLVDNIIDTFKNKFNTDPTIIIRSPGRINLIGEHTDYNGGYVLPAAIDKAVYFAISPRVDNECHFIAHDLGEYFTVSLENLNKTDTYSWANYLMGVLVEIKKSIQNPTILRGINLVFGADLPSGGGMSSSAAIENGIGFAVNHLFDLGLSRMDLVKISQNAENNFVGMKCGIMDMFASMMGRENHVIRIDCRDLSYDLFPFNAPDLRIVLCDTMVKHALVDSEYNTRRAQCEEGVAILQQLDPSIKTLRDVSLSFLEKNKTALSEVVYKRCKYVVEEIERVEKACIALQKNDFKTVGKLMYKTHHGLNVEYDVSCPELNFLVEMARNTEGVLGARMMGGGFGGCTINLVKSNYVETFTQSMAKGYQRVFKKDMPYYVVAPQMGTDIIS